MFQRAWARLLLLGAVLVAPRRRLGQAIMGTVGGIESGARVPLPEHRLAVADGDTRHRASVGSSSRRVSATSVPTTLSSRTSVILACSSCKISTRRRSSRRLRRLRTTTEREHRRGAGSHRRDRGRRIQHASVISAPFNASSTITPITLPGSIAGYQTQAIVFNSAGRAFVYNTAGISVLDPPYSSVAFTIPDANVE